MKIQFSVQKLFQEQGDSEKFPTVFKAEQKVPHLDECHLEPSYYCGIKLKNQQCFIKYKEMIVKTILN
ncbi:CLUMA_CG015037, isoform A [Clunio marinus]|uniref:CLUMA_CG015037, isoform A n=1 Tax=Clunio marinus TaxID=568069 RepID=A0A1J1IRV7_9DIPT|nr:CLUMA_CG015037, isoform A [Clunio marinus]